VVIVVAEETIIEVSDRMIEEDPLLLDTVVDLRMIFVVAAEEGLVVLHLIIII
jgi:hypothetical protein